MESELTAEVQATLLKHKPVQLFNHGLNNIDLDVDSCDNFVQSASRATGHDCSGEAFATGSDTTALSPNSAVASLRSSLSPCSFAVKWHPPPPHSTPPSFSPPNYVIPSPNSFLNFVSANALVVILYATASLIILSVGLVRWHADVELHSTSTMVLVLALVVLTWILLYCICRVRSNLDHLLWIGQELRLAAMMLWFQLITWSRNLRGWVPRHGLLNRVETASLSLLGLRLSALLSGISYTVFNLITKLKNIVSDVLLILAYGYRYFSTKLVTVVSLLGLLLLALVFCGTHPRMTAGNTVAGLFSCDDEECYHERNMQNRPLLLLSKKSGMVWWIAIASATFLVVVVVVAVAICCIAALLWYKCGNRAQQNQPHVQIEVCRVSGPRRFQFDELAAATNNFTDENKLGQGGFGPVYWGFLGDQDRHVAIKMLSAETSWQGKKEFDAEVKVLTQLRHRNIVQLVGWCDSNEGLLLVYELMAEGSLDKHLYNPVRILSWQQRYKIILDLGSALLYLHHGCDKCIVHGDIKPENVMLDALFNAKLSDFGTARLVEHGAEPRTTETVAGTRGYIDPDFVNSHLRCPEADMYSFGVVLLEIASGKRPASRQPNEAPVLPVWVRNLYDRGMLLDAADAKMNGDFDEQQIERVLVTGLWCAHQYPSQRPSIQQAMDVLRCVNATLPVLPATHDAQRVCFLEEQAYGDLTGQDGSVDAVATSTCYLTSKDAAYPLAKNEPPVGSQLKLLVSLG